MTAIRQTLVKQESIDVHFEDGKSVSINSDQRRLYLHFSGLGDQVIRPGEFGGNTIDINYVDWERRAEFVNGVFGPLVTHLSSDIFHTVRRFLVQSLRDANDAASATLCQNCPNFIVLKSVLESLGERHDAMRKEWLPVIGRFSATGVLSPSQGG